MKTRPVIVGAAGLLAVVVLWQLVALGPMSGSALPSASTTFSSLVQELATAGFWVSLGETVAIALFGLVSAAAVGIVVGILIGSFPPFRYATVAVLEFLKPIPPIVILPLVVLILGPTSQMSWFLVFLGCVLPVIMQTIAGVHDTDPVAQDTARSYGMSPTEIMARVVLPSAMPFIGTAMRVAAPAALVITVVAGLLGGGPGLGKSIYLAQTGGDYPSLYGQVLVLGVLGLIFQSATRFVESKLLHWHESYRQAVV